MSADTPSGASSSPLFPAEPERLRAGSRPCDAAGRDIEGVAGEVVAQERADLLAYLDRRIGNHETVAGNPTGSEERAAWLARECRVIRDHVAAGLHEGDAQVAADLARQQEESNHVE